jgi:putative transposase
MNQHNPGSKHMANARRMNTVSRAYYHGARTHLSLEKDAPETRPVQPPTLGSVVELAEVGGLHHRYERRAA